MSFKEHVKSVMSYFFVIVTLINVATFILGELFHPDERFGYEAFLSPLIYAAVAVIPMLCMYSKKEFTIKQQMIRELLLLAAIEIILIFFSLGADSLDPGNLVLTVSFALSVLIIFILVGVIGWLLDWKTAKKLNADLKLFQNRVSEQS